MTAPDGPTGGGLIACIPTFGRPSLLARLVTQLATQTDLVNRVVVVDGDPGSGEVLTALAGLASSPPFAITYVPSNHANLAFQRYVGWLAASELGFEVLIYLDDDLELTSESAVNRVVSPLRSSCGVVAVTAEIEMGDPSRLAGAQPLLADRARSRLRGNPAVVRVFGSSRATKPGGLSPSGRRQLPLPSASGYADVEWLRGGVMAFGRSVLADDSFLDDLFALYELRCGRGEDVVLGCRVRGKGRILLASGAGFLHSHCSPPVAYSTRAVRSGFVASYSRRLINDYLRADGRRQRGDRVRLAWSYLGNIALNWLRAVSPPRRQRLSFAWGYACGVLAAVFRSPRARTLTPTIRWREDARVAVEAATELAGCQVVR